MEQRYSIARKENGTWVVCADGQEFFTCTSESKALKAAQEAADLLNQPTTSPSDTTGVLASSTEATSSTQ
jgi:hypothetical protein